MLEFKKFEVFDAVMLFEMKVRVPRMYMVQLKCQL